MYCAFQLTDCWPGWDGNREIRFSEFLDPESILDDLMIFE